MEIEQETKESRDLDEAYRSLPEEVQGFVASDGYNLIVLGIGDALALSQEQLEKLRYISYEILLGTMTLDQAATALVEDNLFTVELGAKALFAVEQELLSRAQTLLDEATEEHPDDLSESTPALDAAPSPTQMVARINETLSKPAFVMPTKREHGLTKLESTPPSSQPPRIDPYREIPEQS